jgi:thioredoxin 1
MFAVNDQNLEFFINPKRLVLVTFWADNCPYCDLLKPTIIDLANKYDEEMWTLTAKKEENPESLTKHQVLVFPTVILFYDGEEIDRITGNQRHQVMKDFIEKGIEHGDLVCAPNISSSDCIVY